MIKNIHYDLILKNGTVVLPDKTVKTDIGIKGESILTIGDLSERSTDYSTDQVIDCQGLHILPGVIDSQVHFREPGLENKENLESGMLAAAAGGVTAVFEMPNTNPLTITPETIKDKLLRASRVAWTDYAFYLGGTGRTGPNLDKWENAPGICGIKIFMGSSTGNMLVDDMTVLEKIFSKAHMLIATHCEDEDTIRKNMAHYKNLGEPLTAAYHPIIRSREGCLISSTKASELAKRHGARLHILHISTKEELALFDNTIPLKDKLLTSEACVHHMFFDSSDYATLGNKIKCNPAIKDQEDKEAIFQALLDNKIDVIATDHAPHTVAEKNADYMDAPSGLPLIQHTLNIMMDFYHKGKISKERIVEKMCHAPADLFNVQERGYLDEGRFADIVIVDPNAEMTVEKKDLFYKCAWSPLEGYQFKGKVEQVFVNGIRKYRKGRIINQAPGKRLTFDIRH